MISLTVIIGNLSYMLIACSFMVKDMLWLRGLSIAASCCGIIYSSTVTSEPLWTPIIWGFVFISLNIYHISKIIMENKGIVFNDKETELFETVFASLSPLEFKKLNDLAEWKQVQGGVEIVHQGQKMSSLYLIYNGTADVELDGKGVAQLKDGQFIGEMSFLSEGNATATVKSHYPTEYLVWNQENLKGLLGRNPSLLFSLQKAMGIQISNVLTGINKKSAA